MRTNSPILPVPQTLRFKVNRIDKKVNFLTTDLELLNLKLNLELLNRIKRVNSFITDLISGKQKEKFNDSRIELNVRRHHRFKAVIFLIRT
jgi:hypothetical protein